MPRSIKTAVPNREGKEEAVSPQKKEANPASLRGHSLLPMEGGAPKGRRLDGESGMKKSEGDRLKQAIYESTRAPLRGPPSPIGKANRRRLRRKKGNQPRLAAWTLPPSYGRRCPEGAEVGWENGVCEEIRSTASARRHFPITACMLISVVQ